MIQLKPIRSLLAVTVLFSKVLLCLGDAHTTGNVTVLNVLALGPYPSTSEALSPSWAGGPALIPAAQLAAELINNDSSILPGYRLSIVPVNSGCELISTLFINFLEQLFYSRDATEHGSTATVGIVGPGCSEATIALAPVIVRDEINLMQISIATTPQINENKVYNNTFRAVSSAFKFIDTFKSLINQTNWTRYAVLHDSARIFHKALFVQFRDTFKNQSNILYSSGVMDHLLKGAFDTLLQLQLRIIFVFARGQAARNVLCVAYNQSMLFPSYQWIFTERVMGDFLKDTVVNFTGQGEHGQIKCSKDEMEKAVNGIILSEFQFKREDSDTETISHLNFSNYDSKYKEFFSKHLEEYGLNESNVTAGAELYAYPYFDATWALALALNSSLKELTENNLSLALHYRHGMTTTKAVGNLIQKHMRSLTFEGFGGTIMYDGAKSRSISPSISVRVIQVNLTQDDKADMVCLYVREKCTDFDSSNVKILKDKFEPDIIKPPRGLGVFLLIFAFFLFVAVALLQIVFMYHSDKKSIKATSPYLSSLIFSGSYLSLVAVVSFTIRETFVESIHQRPVEFGVLCNTFILCTAFAETLIFGTLCVKTWRIYRIFGYFRQGRVRYVSDGLLLSFVILLLVIDSAFLLAWNLINPWQISVKNYGSANGDDLKLQYTCVCDNVAYWAVSLGVYKGILVAVVVYLSILIRRIKRKEFIFTKYIIALIYLLILLNATLVPVQILFSELLPLLSFLAQNMLVLSTVVASCVFLFIPPLRLVWIKHSPHQTWGATSIVNTVATSK